LSEALKNGHQVLSELEQEGVVQRFKYTYELGWKTLKDYLQHSGVTINPVTPRQVFKAAFKANLIDTESIWIDMLNHRNLLAHDYDENQFADALQAIFQDYLPILHSLKIDSRRILKCS
jgi:nucleotidyltransferase substrate binding protein (TIGR01987 family)